MNNIPKKYRKEYIGCKPNIEDNRDITLEDVAFGGAYIPDPNCPSYKKGFSNEKKYGRLIRDHQGSSFSCVGNGWSKYAEMLNLIEIGKVLNLSAKDIYSQIFLSQGGAYIRSGAKIVVKSGVCEESFISSYPDHGNPDEDFMREDKHTLESRENALIYKAKTYVYLPVSYPMTEQNWEDVRQVIWQFGGFVSGYGRHCVYFYGYGIDPNNGLKYIEYLNSYGKEFGEDGRGKWFEGYGRLFNITFLIDQPNIYHKTKMKKVILNEKEQYVVNGKTIHHIPDLSTRNFLLQLGWIVEEIDKVEDLSNYEIGLEVPSLMIMEEMKRLKPILDDAIDTTTKIEKNFSAGFTLGRMYSALMSFFRKK